MKLFFSKLSWLVWFIVVLSLLAGLSFGIYLAVMVAPLVMSNLPGISVAIAGFIAVAVSVAVIAVCARVFSTLGMWMDALISRIALARQSKLTPIEIAVAKMDIVQAVALGGPLTELTYFVRANDGLIPKIEERPERVSITENEPPDSSASRLSLSVSSQPET